jgi:hypothetical protein
MNTNWPAQVKDFTRLPLRFSVCNEAMTQFCKISLQEGYYGLRGKPTNQDYSYPEPLLRDSGMLALYLF